MHLTRELLFFLKRKTSKATRHYVDLQFHIFNSQKRLDKEQKIIHIPLSTLVVSRAGWGKWKIFFVSRGLGEIMECAEVYI